MGFLSLFRPKYKHSEPKIRGRAVEKLNTKIELLIKIAKDDDDFDVRLAAYKKLGRENTKEAIFDVAQNAEDVNLSRIAIRKIDDEKELASISKNAKAYYIRRIAYKKLGKENSQEALFDLVKNDDNSNARSIIR